MLGKLSISAMHGPKPLVPNSLIELKEGGRRAESAYTIIYQFQDTLLPRQ